MKRKNYFGIAAVFSLLTAVLLCTACPTDDGGDITGGGGTPQVVSIKILRDGVEVKNEISVAKNEELNFTAEVEVKGSAAKTVKWTVNSTKSGITQTGKLIIASTEEDNAVLTVKAASVDPDKFATITLKVRAADAPAVTGITVSAEDDAASINTGGTLQFSASVTVENGAAQTVTWSIFSSGHASGTGISATGLLTVASDETKDSITVRATSDVQDFTTVHGDKTITITSGGAPTVTVTVSAADNAASVEKGKTLQFTATVSNGAAQTVTWTILSSGHAAGTGIDEDGLLTVATAETQSSITVRATSDVTGFTDKYGEKTVTVYSPIVFGDLEMYKGGARTGLALVPLNDFPWYSHTGTQGDWAGELNPDWAANITLEAAGAGYNGGAAIKVGKYAGNDDTGFGLALDENVAMSSVKALSFRAKTDTGTINIRRAGFGDEGIYNNWSGTHKGVMYIGENHDETIPVDTTWKRFIVPVPYGATAPDMKRIFTLVATIPDGNFLYIDGIEFLTDGVTCTGISVPNARTGVDVGTDVNVSLLFGKDVTAWTFKLDSDNSVWSIYITTGAWAHLNGWALPANYDKYEVVSVTGTNEVDVTIATDNLSIKTSVGFAEITLVLKNGQNLQTNAIAIMFGEAGVKVIQDLGAISSGLWFNAWASWYGVNKGGRDCAGANLGAEWYAAFGSADFDPSLDISEYTTITFSVYVDTTFGDDGATAANPIGKNFEFGIDCGPGTASADKEFYITPFTITSDMDQTWTQLTFNLADFKLRSGTAITTTNLQDFKAWRFAGADRPNQWYTWGNIWIDKIEVK